MEKFSVYAYNDHDDKLLVYQSASLSECVSVAQALYSASDLEFKILNASGKSCVLFIKPIDN